MDELDKAILRCGVPLKRDKNTAGDGNCFPRSIVQQCERKVVCEWLRENNPLKIASSYHDLRRKVTKFALSESTKQLRDMKEAYNSVQGPIDGFTWKSYWCRMWKDKIWADETFIQVTAWYLGLDIKILSTVSKPTTPFITVKGEEGFLSESSKPRPKLFVGYYPFLHYQSLLPIVETGSKSPTTTNSKLNMGSPVIQKSSDLKEEDIATKTESTITASAGWTKVVKKSNRKTSITLNEGFKSSSNKVNLIDNIPKQVKKSEPLKERSK